MRHYNTFVQYNGFYISVNPLVNETALVFQEGHRTRYWILNGDVRAIYEGVKTLKEAKDIFRKAYKNGNHAFWSDYSDDEDF